MKKLNKKGFTLVELLAVIIILAIVVGITIPAVLTTTSKARDKAFKTAADTVADWVDRQYELYRMGADDLGIGTLDKYFALQCARACGSNKPDGSTFIDNPTDSNCGCDARVNFLTKEFIIAAGLKPGNIDTSYSNTYGSLKVVDGRIYLATDGTTPTNFAYPNGNGDYNKTRVYINPANGRSCVTLKASADSPDYPKGKIACGGVCQDTADINPDYCKAS